MSFLAFAQDQCALGRAAEAERQLLAQFPQQPFPPSADFGLALAHCNLCLEKLDQVEVCLGRVAADHGDSGALLQLALACARRRGEGSCLPRFRPPRPLPWCVAVAERGAKVSPCSPSQRAARVGRPMPRLRWPVVYLRQSKR